jgi:hypothetical protein
VDWQGSRQSCDQEEDGSGVGVMAGKGSWLGGEEHFSRRDTIHGGDAGHSSTSREIRNGGVRTSMTRRANIDDGMVAQEIE